MANKMANLYLGSRGTDFKNMIVGLLKRGKLKPKYIDLLTNEKSMKEYGLAFTGETADKVNNYERYEQIGDVTANKFIVWYSYRRFPQLDCTDGVKVVARLRINYGSKQFFGPLGEQLDFWPFISAEIEGTERTKYYRNRNKKDLLEDCVESFVGCTEYLLDKAFRPGVGYAIVYDILADIFDKKEMSLKYEDLYDPKTRLKETFDLYKQLGGWYFHNTREDIDGGYTMANSVLYQTPPETNQRPNRKVTGPNRKTDFVLQPQRDWVQLGVGDASKKGDAEQKAAEKGIETLKHMGFYKEAPPEYLRFCQFKN
jgi:dsRNA-specific ribonuclease